MIVEALQVGSLFTYVPGQQPIELVASYKELHDYYPYCEMQTKRWFVENVKPDWTIFHVGANIGYYCILFSRLCSDGAIHAFEPTKTIDLLEKNIAYHKVHNVKTHRVALGVRSGRHQDAIYRIWGHDPELGPYDFLTLDDAVRLFSLQRLDCIKIDVDSFDFDVLRGGERSLYEFNPWIIIELNHALEKRGQSSSQAFEWLLAQGYQDALVLDYDNFVLRRSVSARSSSPPAALGLSFDHRPIFVVSGYQKGEILSVYFQSTPQTHGTSRTEGGLESPTGIQLQNEGPRWSYGMSFDRTKHHVDQKNAIIIEVELEVTSGMVGVGCVENNYSTYVGSEVTISTASGKQIATIIIENAELIAALVFRRVGEFDVPTTAIVSNISVFSGIAGKSEYETLALREDLTSLTNADLNHEAGICLGQNNSTASIDVVASHRIGKRLQYAREFTPPFKIYRRTLSTFKMEIDDAPILRFIYQNGSPLRHLEFGTWQGFGATLCASCCEAEIWTINLPFGEYDALGQAQYFTNFGTLPSNLVTLIGSSPDQRLQSDAGEMIGWMYRSAGFASRVHQILGDSQDLELSDFRQGFFDSILIDGGHAPEVVTSDTEKALPLLRAGGMMMWHDFCPDAATINALPACKGVVTAIATNLEKWRPLFRDIFWIQPSFLLVGIKG